MFLLWLRQLPRCGDGNPASVPPPTEGRSSPTNTVFLPCSFVLPSFVWFYTFFATLSWCSACTSVSEGVFLMYPWREIHSTSTYFSTILFSLSLLAIFWNCAFWWVYLSFPPLPLASLLISAICKVSSDNHFVFSHFFFLGMVLITISCTLSQTSIP